MKNKSNSNKVIYDLCSGTGSFSQPYVDAGYDVKRITVPDVDVLSLQMVPDEKIYGIIACPPCTHFSRSGAQYWPVKDFDGRTQDSINIVSACCRIILMANPTFWIIENPVGRLRRWLGPPKVYIEPYHYGDPWSKKTCWWGVFNMPKKNPVEPIKTPQYSSPLMRLGGNSKNGKEIRSKTPPMTAKAFFESNR
jgi:hypothetical protein